MTKLTCPECFKMMDPIGVGRADEEESTILWGCECGHSSSFGNDDIWAFCMGCRRYFPPSDKVPYSCPSCDGLFNKFGDERVI